MEPKLTTILLAVAAVLVLILASARLSASAKGTSELLLAASRITKQQSYDIHYAQGRNAFVVGIDETPTWRDAAALAVIPAAHKINGGKPVVVLAPATQALDRRATAFLEMYTPDNVYSIGITQVKRILFDEAHPINWTSIQTNYREFANALRSRGYQVEALTTAPVTTEVLTAYDVYVVATSWGTFTPAEIDAIVGFVESGGGLFLTGLGWSWVNPDQGRTLDNYPMNILAAPFNIRFLEDAICDPDSNYEGNWCNPVFSPSVGHDLATGLSEVGGPIVPSPLQLLGDDVQAVITGSDSAYSNGGNYAPGSHPPLLVATQRGQGRVVAVGHEAYLSNDDYDQNGTLNLDDYDNRQLGLNIIDWLAANSQRSDSVGTVIPGDDEIQVAANLAQLFWTDAHASVIASQEDYTGSLIASNLAARLSIPLLYVTASAVPAETQATLAHLGTVEILAVGNISDNAMSQLQGMGLTITHLTDAIQVALYLTNRGLPSDYVAIANPFDRSYGGEVPKLSLLAPVLAAYHDGVVYPASYESQWKIPFTATEVTHTKPSGAVEGIRRFDCDSLTTASPPRASGASWQLYSLNGNYGMGRLRYIAGNGNEISFYLGASAPSATFYDRVLIDLDRDGFYSDNEIFDEGSEFIINSRKYVVTEVSGDGLWAGVEEYVELTFSTWQLGTITMHGHSYPFAATSTGSVVGGHIGFYDTVNIDLNGNRRYGDSGEGPFHSSDTIVIDNNNYVISVGTGEWTRPVAIKLTFPDARVLAAELQSFYALAQLHPTYLAIVGYYDAIPFALYRPEVEPYIGHEDVVSDIAYGEVDNDPFVDIATGRVVATSVYNASLLVARSVTYKDLLTPAWGNNALTISGYGDQQAIAKFVANNLENHGFSVTNLIDDFAWQDSYLVNKSVILHFEHAGPGGWGRGPWYRPVQNMNLAPTVAMSGGCMTAAIDEVPKDQSIALAFLDSGAIGYVGNSRTASNPIFSYLGTFWDGVANRRLSIGEAHRRGQNFKILQSLERSNPGPGYDHIAMWEIMLLGDPALSLYIPSPSPSVSPAHMVVSEDAAEYHGPAQWWSDTVDDWDTGTVYMRSGPGTFFIDFMDRIWFLAEVPVPQTVISVTQDTSLTPPLGWTGEFFIDEGWATQRTFLWRLQPITYDKTDGVITAEALTIRYTLVHAYDFDGDCDIDIVDIMTVASHWNCQCGNDCYDHRYDLDHDCDIDIVDIMLVAGRWGCQCGDDCYGTRASAISQVEPRPLMAPAALRVEPASSTVMPGETFTVAVEIEGAVNLGGFQWTLSFDPAVVQVQEVTLGGFLASTGRNSATLGPEVDNDAGTVTFGAFSFGDQPGPNGNGVLAILTLTAQGTGDSPLALKSVQVADTGGQTQAVTAKGGRVMTGAALRTYLPIVVVQ